MGTVYFELVAVALYWGGLGSPGTPPRCETSKTPRGPMAPSEPGFRGVPAWCHTQPGRAARSRSRLQAGSRRGERAPSRAGAPSVKHGARSPEGRVETQKERRPASVRGSARSTAGSIDRWAGSGCNRLVCLTRARGWLPIDGGGVTFGGVRTPGGSRGLQSR